MSKDTEKKVRGSFKRHPRKKESFDKEKYQKDRTPSSHMFTCPTAETENDPSWHGADTDFGKDAGSVSFNHRVGEPFNDEIINECTNTAGFSLSAANKDYWDSEYGIVAIDLMSTLPIRSYDIGSSSILQQVMNKFNSQVRKTNSGAKNYEPVDLLIYNIAYSEAACYYAACCRIYGAILNYEKRNSYFSEAYVRAVGGNYSDLKDKLPEFRAYLKSFATRLNALTAVELPYFKRKVVLCSNTYKDEPDGLNCQIYVPRFRQWLIFEVDSTNGSTLRSSNNSGYYSWSDFSGDFSNMTLAAIKELGDYMLNQLLTDADVATMSGDILKRFEGTNSIVNLSWIEENYYVMPQYSEEFLEEFENCHLVLNETTAQAYTLGTLRGTKYSYQGVLGLANAYLGEITQNAGKIVQVNMFDASNVDARNGDAYLAYSIVPRTVNFKNGNTDPSRLITATRLLATTSVQLTSKSGANMNYSWKLSQCDTEVVIRFTVYTKINKSNLGSPFAIVVNQLAMERNIAMSHFYANAIAQFKYLPPLIIYTERTDSDDDPDGIQVQGVIRNLDKATVLTKANLDSMTTCSSMFEFGLDENSAMNK